MLSNLRAIPCRGEDPSKGRTGCVTSCHIVSPLGRVIASAISAPAKFDPSDRRRGSRVPRDRCFPTTARCYGRSRRYPGDSVTRARYSRERAALSMTSEADFDLSRKSATSLSGHRYLHPTTGLARHSIRAGETGELVKRQSRSLTVTRVIPTILFVAIRRLHARSAKSFFERGNTKKRAPETATRSHFLPLGISAVLLTHPV